MGGGGVMMMAGNSVCVLGVCVTRTQYLGELCLAVKITGRKIRTQRFVCDFFKRV
jgi:hypothetical protein